MSRGWDESAGAWIASMQGDRGDWGRERVLDPLMLERIDGHAYRRALDIGCGEGRFCRKLRERGMAATGIDPTEALLAEARRLDPAGDYRLARAEALPFDNASFDLVVSYLTLIDIADFRAAIAEMARVLAPRGRLLIANLNSFSTARPQSWIRRMLAPVDNYLDERASWQAWRGIRVENWHRPLSAYMQALLGAGLLLTFFDEPEPRSGDPIRRASYRRAPWLVVMEWEKPGQSAPK